jgi:predicted HTH transcriptional regulator
MLFRNRLEVWNPGTLPYGLTPEKLLQPHPSVPANPILANPIYLAGYIERMGTGTRDIVNKCRAIGLKDPEFIQEEDFKVILWRKELGDEGVNEGANKSKQFENKIDKIYSLIREGVNEPLNYLTHFWNPERMRYW